MKPVKLGNNFLIGFTLCVVAYIFSTVETIYFGSNLWAESFAEWACDAISLVLSLIGIALIIKDFRKNNK